jgi:hypothetical protein
MFLIIEILDNIASQKRKSQFYFFSKIDRIYGEKKALLASFYLDCTVKRGGGGRTCMGLE